MPNLSTDIAKYLYSCVQEHGEGVIKICLVWGTMCVSGYDSCPALPSDRVQGESRVVTHFPRGLFKTQQRFLFTITEVWNLSPMGTIPKGHLVLGDSKGRLRDVHGPMVCEVVDFDSLSDTFQLEYSRGHIIGLVEPT